MKTTETRKTVNDIITERIMAMLEQGVAPWQKPWRVASQMPRNLVSGKPYRGINVFLLHAAQFQSPHWLTFRQAQELGGNVRRGEKAMPVVFWKKIEPDEQQTPDDKPAFVLRYYSVFNLCQIENVKEEAPADQAGNQADPGRPDHCRHAEPARDQIRVSFMLLLPRQRHRLHGQSQQL